MAFLFCRTRRRGVRVLDDITRRLDLLLDEFCGNCIDISSSSSSEDHSVDSDDEGSSVILSSACSDDDDAAWVVLRCGIDMAG